MEKPYLSFIVASRNDNHGKDMFKRMSIFMRGLLAQTRKYDLPVELILVEWNPPADKPLLHEVLPAPQPGDKLTVRYIVVPNEIHRRYRTGNTIPLFQMIAKNVGIRRAKGEYLLCTNVDLLFSDELFAYMAKRPFQPNRFYRANRVDIPAEIEESWSLEQQLSYAKTHIIRVNGKRPGLENIEFRSKLFDILPFTEKAINAASQLKRKLMHDPAWIKLHQADLEACGDFTLMHRDAWHNIEGYVELDMYSIHVDTLGVYSMLAKGYEQTLLPPECCTYHIDHEAGWSSMDDLEKFRFLALRPGLESGMVKNVGMLMIQRGELLGTNPPNWGWADEVLPEYTLTANGLQTAV